MDIADVPMAILAGGLATRLGAEARRVPKSLVDVAGRPFIDHQLGSLRRSGFRQVVLCVGHLGEQIEAHVGSGNPHGLTVRYSYDGPRLLGTGGALRRALPLLGELFWVMYGDSYLDMDFAGILAEFLPQKAAGGMTVLRNQDRWERSNVRFEGGRLLAYDKKTPTAEMQHVDYGALLLRRSAVERISPDQPSDMADVLRTLVSEGRMVGFEVTQRFYEIGSPDGLAEARGRLQGQSRG
jgi:NDP-sugar pyrophosphorylase family protein